MKPDLWQYFSDLPGLQIKDGLHFAPGIALNKNFEELYLRLRSKEGRFYSDEVVKFLPEIAPSHLLFKEWITRRSSADKLASYLKKRKHNTPTILEIGCGNGWFANYLSNSIKCVYCGIDVNKTELRQAARLFNKGRKVFFVHTDIFTANLPENQIDYILLASSIQYFKSLDGLIDRLIPSLTSNGEIHIIDSPIYQTAEAATAKERTRAYFTNQGFEKMNAWYFHHTWSELESFNIEILAKPSPRIISRFLRGRSTPFPWIKITT